ERELEAQRADVRGAIEAAGHVVGRVAMSLARGENQLRQVEDLEVAIEAVVLAEADQAVDVFDAADRQRLFAINRGDLLLVKRALRTVEQLREARIDELRVE